MAYQDGADSPDPSGGAGSPGQARHAAPMPAEATIPAATGFGWIVLPRHGKRPLSFRGRNMLHVGDRMAAQRSGRPSWSMLSVYEHEQDGFVTSLRHAETCGDAILWQDSWDSHDARAVIASLYGHDIAAALLPATGPALRDAHAAWTILLGNVFGVRDIP